MLEGLVTISGCLQFIFTFIILSVINITNVIICLKLKWIGLRIHGVFVYVALLVGGIVTLDYCVSMLSCPSLFKYMIWSFIGCLLEKDVDVCFSEKLLTGGCEWGNTLAFRFCLCRKSSLWYISLVLLINQSAIQFSTS